MSPSSSPRPQTPPSARPAHSTTHTPRLCPLDGQPQPKLLQLLQASAQTRAYINTNIRSVFAHLFPKFVPVLDASPATTSASGSASTAAAHRPSAPTVTVPEDPPADAASMAIVVVPDSDAVDVDD